MSFRFEDSNATPLTTSSRVAEVDGGALAGLGIVGATYFLLARAGLTYFLFPYAGFAYVLRGWWNLGA